jgi:ubiquinone/menaquinone biosynthesis C-methylase UbiE
MTEYIFDNAAPQVARRFDALAALYDPMTARHLKVLGVTDGWHCLEVGGGSGSVAAWLARRVGPTGRVVVTDIDPRHMDALQEPGLANVEVRRHDITADPLEDEAFDLVHARLVLSHLPALARREALGRMVAALRPGGWLVVEDFDLRFADPTWPTEDRAFAALYAKMQDALIRLLESRGAGPDWAHQLPAALHALGLQDIGAEGHFALAPGRSASARLYRANIEQVRGEAVRAGLMTDEEVDELLAGLDDESRFASTRVMISAWGHRLPA